MTLTRGPEGVRNEGVDCYNAGFVYLFQLFLAFIYFHIFVYPDSLLSGLFLQCGEWRNDRIFTVPGERRARGLSEWKSSKTYRNINVEINFLTTRMFLSFALFLLIITWVSKARALIG